MWEDGTQESCQSGPIQRVQAEGRVEPRSVWLQAHTGQFRSLGKQQTPEQALQQQVLPAAASLQLVCAGVLRAHLKSQGFHVFINLLLFSSSMLSLHAAPAVRLASASAFFLEGKKTLLFLKSEQLSTFPDRMSSECVPPKSYASPLKPSSSSSEHDFIWKHGQST